MASRRNVRWLRSFVGVVVGVGTILIFAHGARGQVAYELLHAFPIGGAYPTSPLIQASDGTFYGTTTLGGPFGSGTVFKLTTAGTLTTQHVLCDMRKRGNLDRHRISSPVPGGAACAWPRRPGADSCPLRS